MEFGGGFGERETLAERAGALRFRGAMMDHGKNSHGAVRLVGVEIGSRVSVLLLMC